MNILILGSGIVGANLAKKLSEQGKRVFLLDDDASELKRLFPKKEHAVTELTHWKTPWELLVAVILSAQCTDKRVNIVIKDLFIKYKTIEDYANAKQEEFEQDIYSTGFYKNKAKNIIILIK